jgi:Raf kinase inhibitor-like YbhB/YbcL family protein
MPAAVVAVPIELSSPAFTNGEQIPRQYGYSERNANPPLSWSGLPDDAASLALVVDDPGAVEPAGKVWDHWTVWNITPERTEIPEGWTPNSAVEGRNDFGSIGYGGPNPPDSTHTYEFRLYALDERLTLEAGATKSHLEEAMADHILAEAVLCGTYAP